MVRKKQLHAFVPTDEYVRYSHEAANHGIELAELVRRRMRQEPLPPISDDREEETEDDAE